MSRITDRWRRASWLDNAAPTQFSLRPTIRRSAQINALAKLFPQRTKTDILNDLISIGLKQVIEEITEDQDFYDRTGIEERELHQYSEEAQRYIKFYQEELKDLLDKAEKESQKKGGK